MRLLELFSGTGSVGKAMSSFFDEIVSLDVLPKCGATITTDILTWDYKAAYPSGYFDYIWSSPPCTEYSLIRTLNKKPPNLVWADSIVKKTKEIIDYFQPRVWFIENPQTGTLKTRPCMVEWALPYIDCDYCQFSDWGYKKRTRFWTNQEGLVNVLCTGEGHCLNMIGSCHLKHVAVRSERGTTIPTTVSKKSDLHRIPFDLVKYLFKHGGSCM